MTRMALSSACNYKTRSRDQLALIIEEILSVKSYLFICGLYWISDPKCNI